MVEFSFNDLLSNGACLYMRESRCLPALSLSLSDMQSDLSKRPLFPCTGLGKKVGHRLRECYRQKKLTLAGTKFTKPEAFLLSELCIRRSIKWEDLFRVAGENFSDGTSFGEELSARVSGPEELRIGWLDVCGSSIWWPLPASWQNDLLMRFANFSYIESFSVPNDELGGNFGKQLQKLVHESFITLLWFCTHQQYLRVSLDIWARCCLSL